MTGTVNYSLERLEFDEGDRSHIEAQLRLLKQVHGISGKRVIEYGCGFGHNLELFRDDNDVAGVEGLPAAVERAQANGLAVSLCDLNRPTALGDRSADVVLCIDVLEHLTDPEIALADIARVLVPGGIAILNVPNHFDLAGRIKILLGRSLDTHGYFPEHDQWDNPHIRFFTHDGFLRFVARSGLRLVEDRSPAITSFPLQARLGGRLQRLRGTVARRFPGLFSAGFFLVVQRPQ